jgi:hypothetical protein
MPRLPSGVHYCINTDPLADMLRLVQAGHGLFLPALLSIRTAEDLRPYLRLLWLLPLGADNAVDSPLHSLSEQVPAGLSLIDSGYKLDRLSDCLDEADRDAFSLFWESPRCREFLRLHLETIIHLQQSLLHSQCPEDRLLAEWFGLSSPAESIDLPLLAEDEAERNAPLPVHSTPQKPSSSQPIQ